MERFEEKGENMLIKNTMSKFTFVMKQIIYSVVVWLLNNSLFYDKMDELGISELLLLYFLYECSLIGIAIEIEKRRNEISIAMNIMIAYGLYIAASYYETRKEIVLSVFFCAIIVSIFFIRLIFKEKIDEKKKYRNLLRNRIFQSAAIVQLTLSISMLILTVLIFGVNKSERIIAQRTETVNMNIEADSGTLKNNEKVILMLQEKSWNKLSLTERVNTLVAIADMECVYLGMPKDLVIAADHTLEDTTLGTYEYRENEITINMNVIYESGEQSLEVLLHEIRHAFQHRLVEAYRKIDDEEKNLKVFQEIKLFASEFRNYEDKNYKIYYNQRCEQDCREYARERMEEYYSVIYDK